MAAEGFYLVQGDKTTCGEKITTGAEDHTQGKIIRSMFFVLTNPHFV